MTSTAPYAHLFWRYFLLKCIFFYCNIVLVSFAGELRFCYNGPQRIRYKDCPGGFVTYELVESSCIYYHKMEGNPDLEQVNSKLVTTSNTKSTENIVLENHVLIKLVLL